MIRLFVLFFLSVLLLAAPAAAQDAKLIETAKKESGPIIAYGSLEANTVEPIVEAFKKKTGLTVEYWRASATKVMDRALAEQRAGKSVFDVMVNNSGAIQVMKKEGLFAKYISPAAKAFPKEVIDPDLGPVYRNTPIGIVYNKGSISSAETPRSLEDLPNPKYRGKFVMTDPDSAGNIGNWRFIYYSPDLGPKFITRLLTETQVVFAGNEHQMMDWLGAGKYSMHVLAKFENTENARSQGLPVRQIFSEKEGDTISSGSGHIIAFKNAPHPNATKVYLNWFLSRDGQLAWQKLTGRNSFRTDIPKDMIRYKDEQVPKEGGKYLLSSLPQYEDIKPLQKLVDEVLAKAKQK